MENMKNATATEMKYKTVMDDPNTEKYCFADQYEFMMYAKHCKDAGRTSGGVIWINDSSYQEHFKRGYDLFDRGQYEQALTEYMEGLKVNPVGIGARFEICECYLKLRRLSDARRALLDMQEYLIEASYVARFYRRMSFIAVEQRNYRLAVACLLFSMTYEKTPYVAQELMYIQSINGHPIKVSNPQKDIQSAGIPILKGYVFTNEKVG